MWMSLSVQSGGWSMGYGSAKTCCSGTSPKQTQHYSQFVKYEPKMAQSFCCTILTNFGSQARFQVLALSGIDFAAHGHH
jgi:hypothetical protein